MDTRQMNQDSETTVFSDPTEFMLHSTPFRYIHKNCMSLFLSRLIEVVCHNFLYVLRFSIQPNYSVSKILSVYFIIYEFCMSIPNGFFAVLQYHYSYQLSTNNKSQIQKLRADFIILMFSIFGVCVIVMVVLICIGIDWLPAEASETADIKPLVFYFTATGFMIASLVYLPQQYFFIENRFMISFSVGMVLGLLALGIETLIGTFTLAFDNSYYQLAAYFLSYTLVAIWLSFVQSKKTMLGVRNKQEFPFFEPPLIRKNDGQAKSVLMLFLQGAACCIIYITGPVAMLVTMQILDGYRADMLDDDFCMQRNAIFTYFCMCYVFRIAPWACQNLVAKVIVVCDRYESYKRFVDLILRMMFMAILVNVVLFFLLKFLSVAEYLFGRFPDFYGFFGTSASNSSQIYGLICGCLQCFQDVVVIMHLHSRKYATIVAMAVAKYGAGLIMIKVCSNISHENTRFFTPLMASEIVTGSSSCLMFLWEIIVWAKKGNKQNPKKAKRSRRAKS